MLVISRKPGESLFIGGMKVQVWGFKGRVLVGVDAPKEIPIRRSELNVDVRTGPNKDGEGSVQGPQRGEGGLEDGSGNDVRAQPEARKGDQGGEGTR